ncbi:MAG TPA: hypothetical protein VJG90_06280 [Candidatus Nanoarchaeia archaeon]|nr:hypothetical protein [Candidatus Nanoarchaeia archaeon]
MGRHWDSIALLSDDLQSGLYHTQLRGAQLHVEACLAPLQESTFHSLDEVVEAYRSRVKNASCAVERHWMSREDLLCVMNAWSGCNFEGDQGKMDKLLVAPAESFTLLDLVASQMGVYGTAHAPFQVLNGNIRIN